MNSANQVVGSMLKGSKDVVGFIHLKEVNDSLMDANARLQTQLSNYKAEMTEFRRPDFCEDEEDSTSVYIYNYTGAKVINNSVQKVNNYLTIDKGSRHGIRPERGVIGSNGIVGVVKEVSPNFATVISVLHKSMHVSSKLKYNNHKGSLKWGVEDPRYATLEGIPKHVRVGIGDTVLTSGFSTFFPSGVLVGVVADVNTLPQNYFHEIKVKLSTDFNALEFVYVVDYIYKSEQKALEQRTQND